MVREAADIVEDFARRKAAMRAQAAAEEVWRQPVGAESATLRGQGWEMMFREQFDVPRNVTVSTGARAGAVGGRLERGECVTLTHF